MTLEPDHRRGEPIEPQVKESALSDLIALVLRCGVAVAAVIVAGGYLVMLLRHGISARRFHHFTGTPIPGRYGVLDVLVSLRHHPSAAGLITLGLLVLILTPVLRVIMSWIVFLYEKDRLYAWLTAVVIAVLVFSLVGATV